MTIARTVTTGEVGNLWIYQRQFLSGSFWKTIISDPTPTRYITVYNFEQDANSTNFYETQRRVWNNGTGTGTPISTVITCYNGVSIATPANCWNQQTTAQITRVTRFTALPDLTGRVSERDTTYEGNGLVTESDDYDYGAGAAGSIIRKTTVGYYSGWPGIANLPWRVTVSNGGSAFVTTQYAYDESALGTSGVTTQHTNPGCTAPCRGNLTTVNYAVGTTGTLTRTFTYYDTGVLKTSVDVNAPSATTTYTYDLTGSPSKSCNGAFPTMVTLPISGLSRSMAWDCNGGVQTKLTDENSNYQQITSWDADYWRPTAIRDFNGNSTSVSYTPTTVESALTFNGSSSTVDFLSVLDDLGRLQYSQRKQSPSSTSYDSVERLYDPVGRLSQVSMPYVGSASQGPTSPLLTTTTFDGAGRSTQTQDAGGGTIGWSYTNNDVVQTLTSPTSNKVRKMEYDALGRLSSVCEVTTGAGNGTCNQVNSATGYWTKYSYDHLGALTNVSQNAQSTTNNQNRVFTYDPLGRITSEKNPETNNLTSSYVYDTDTTCGTYKGDLVKRTDAVGNVTCYAYDKMHRLTNVTHPSGSYAANTVARCFVYDSATVAGQTMANTKSRLAEAYTTATNCTAAKLTDLGFSYSAAGQVTDVYQSTPHSGSTYYHVSASYWPHGVTDVLSSNISGLPTLYYGASDGSGLDGEGRVTKVTVPTGNGPNPVTGVNYTVSNTAGQPIGSLTNVTFGSSDFDDLQYDTNTGRMTKYTFHMGGSATVTGALGWNSDGTLASLGITDQVNSANSQTCSFTYDDLARLSTSNCGTSIWNQQFGYDPYGNILKTVPTGSTGTSFQGTYSTGTNSKNWLTQIGTLVPTYDNNGNMTSDTVHAYTWDAEGKMLNVDSTSVKLTYDALGRIVEQNRVSVYTQIVYGPGGDKMALMNGQTLIKAFVPLPGGATAVYAPGTTGPIYWRHSDWLGSSRLATTQSRTKYFDVSYAPYGENYKDSGTTDYNFTGQQQDTIAGYFDFPFREYSPVQGRWLSPDPAGSSVASPDNPQSWNRYAYVQNNPLNAIDPNGLYIDGCENQWNCIDLGFDGGVVFDPFGFFVPFNADPFERGGHSLDILPGENSSGFPIGPDPLTVLSQVLSGDYSFFGVPTLGSLTDQAWTLDRALNSDDYCGFGYHCDSGDIAESCAAEAGLAAVGITDLDLYTWDQVKDDIGKILKGPAARAFIGRLLGRAGRGVAYKTVGKAITYKAAWDAVRDGYESFKNCWAKNAPIPYNK